MCFHQGCGCHKCGCAGGCNQGSNNGNCGNNGVPIGYLYAPVSFYSNTGDNGNNWNNDNNERSGCSCGIAFIRCSDCFADSCR